LSISTKPWPNRSNGPTWGVRWQLKPELNLRRAVLVSWKIVGSAVTMGRLLWAEVVGYAGRRLAENYSFVPEQAAVQKPCDLKGLRGAFAEGFWPGSKHGHDLLCICADCSRPYRGRRCPPTCAMIDTLPQPLYTRVDVPVCMVAVSERRFP
jgi:hypothetical protein